MNALGLGEIPSSYSPIWDIAVYIAKAGTYARRVPPSWSKFAANSRVDLLAA